MARTDFQSVPQYIASKPESIQPTLEAVRAIIRKALPKASEVISYQIPAYKLEGTAVIFFAGWQEHYSLYPASAQLVNTLKRELAPYTISKGTIRFPLDQPIPTRLITRIAKLRQEETIAHNLSKATKKKVAKKKVANSRR